MHLFVILFTGGYLTPLPLGPGTPPGNRYTPQTRYTPPDQVHPLDQVHPPGTRYTSWNQVHPPDQIPPGPGTPPGTRYTPHPPGPDTPPVQSMLSDTVNTRAVRILLECNLVFTNVYESFRIYSIFIFRDIYENLRIHSSFLFTSIPEGLKLFVFEFIVGGLRWLFTFVFTDFTEGEHVGGSPGKFQPAVHERVLHNLVTIEIDCRICSQVYRHHISIPTIQDSIVKQV